MRFAGQVPNFFDRGVDFGSRHGQVMENRAEEQTKAWGLEAMVHNAGITRDAEIEMAKADALGTNPGGIANYGPALGSGIAELGGGIGKAIQKWW